MRPSLNLLAILNLLGVAQGVLMTLALLGVKRGNRFANRILAAVTITISIIVGGAVLLDYLISEYYQDSLGGWYYARSAFFIIQFLAYLILIVLSLVKYALTAGGDSPYEKHVLFQVRFFVGSSL